MENQKNRHRDKYKIGDLVICVDPKANTTSVGIIKKRLTGEEIIDILGQKAYYDTALLRERIYNVVFASGTECLAFEGNIKHANERK